MSSSSVARFKFSNLLGKGMEIQILDGSWIRIRSKMSRIRNTAYSSILGGSNHICVVSFWRQMEYNTYQMSILCCSQTVDESSLLEGTGTITQCFSHKRKNFFTVFLQGDFLDFYSVFYIQRCFIYRPSDSTVSENAGIEPRSVAISALAVRGSNSNHSARSHPRLG